MNARAKVYRNIDRRLEWLGVEPFDAVLVGIVLWLTMTFCPDTTAINLLLSAALWLALRLVKRGKPPGYSLAFVRFYVRSPFFCAAAPDTEVDRHPPPWRALNPSPRGLQ